MVAFPAISRQDASSRQIKKLLDKTSVKRVVPCCRMRGPVTVQQFHILSTNIYRPQGPEVAFRYLFRRDAVDMHGFYDIKGGIYQRAHGVCALDFTSSRFDVGDQCAKADGIVFIVKIYRFLAYDAS